MKPPTNYIVLGLTLLFCLLNMYLGWAFANHFILAGGALGCCWVVLRMAYAVRRWQGKRTRSASPTLARA